MEKINLNGEWDLICSNPEFNTKALVPGSDFGNLIKNGIIKNPLISGKEQESLDIAKYDFTFKRSFVVSSEILKNKHFSICCEKIDTLCNCYINDKLAFSSKNSYVPINASIDNLLIEGENTIILEFKSSYNYIKEKQAKESLPKNFNGVDGIPYIRKPGCHFGWDWGPCVPYCGILDDIYIEAYSIRIENIQIFQETEIEKSILTIKADNVLKKYVITPDNKKLEVEGDKLEILNPILWYTRELSSKDSQPLYTVVLENKEEKIERKIGLRKLELDCSKDDYGTNFCFKINNERIFAKGGNLIPFSAIFEDTTKEVVDYYIDLAIKSNFNMLRVWGGGSYADEYLLSQCDEKGILIWQDFCFACQLYPFYDKEFEENVLDEVKANVTRLNMHPSVCILCGNNEIETMYSWMPQGLKLLKAHKKFFYDVLPNYIKPLTNLPYIPTSPLGTDFMQNISSDNYGDTHMWNVWHGLKKLDYYQQRYSRFLSEFGLESLPSMKAINTFAEEKDYDIQSEAFNSHQKCIGGNKKMLFYLTEMFDFPKKFEAIPYLTGIVQAECIKNATVHFRQNKGRCNGSLYWQYNDVWNCPSWSSVDFERIPKALQYKAKEFFDPVTVTCKKQNKKAYIVAHNDTLEKLNMDICMQLVRIKDSSTIWKKEFNLTLEKNSYLNVYSFDIVKNAMLKISFNGKCIYEIFDKPSNIGLKAVDITTKIEDGKLIITSDNVAYNIYIDSNLILDDNYFSLFKGEEKIIDLNGKEIKDIKIMCANNIEFNKNKLKKGIFRLLYRLEPMNIANFLYYSRT